MTIRIAITIRNRLIVGASTNIVNYPYIASLDVGELEERRGRKKKGELEL